LTNRSRRSNCSSKTTNNTYNRLMYLITCLDASSKSRRSRLLRSIQKVVLSTSSNRIMTKCLTRLYHWHSLKFQSTPKSSGTKRLGRSANVSQSSLNSVTEKLREVQCRLSLMSHPHFNCSELHSMLRLICSDRPRRKDQRVCIIWKNS